ncbi:hypothetical protein CsSME_00045008 [Camellia sinensis var. sinensis]
MVVTEQDCLELLNNLIRNNASNQVLLLRETMGFDPLISILKLRGSSYSFTQRRTINLLSALETIGLLIMGGPEIDTGKDANRLTNKAVSVQKKVFDHFLMLGVESQWAPVPVRCTNIDALASKVLGEEPQVEPALNSILRIILRTSSMQEFVAETMFLSAFVSNASIYINPSIAANDSCSEEDVNMSFGSFVCPPLCSQFLI